MDPDVLEEKLTNVRNKLKDIKILLDKDNTLKINNCPCRLICNVNDLLKEVETEVVNISKRISDERKDDVIIMLGIVHLNFGLLHADTENLKTSEEQFMKCIEILKNKELEPRGILPVLSALNQLGIIWSKWSQPSKAKSFLEQAERIYKDFAKTGNEPVNMASNFGIDDNKDEITPATLLEKIHTLTLYYLAQVYVCLKDHHNSSVYCYMTLRKQLDHSNVTQDLEYVEWALNAATLSQYFMENDGFHQARHHLAAASYMMQKYEEILKEKYKSDGDSEALAAERENFKHRNADIARCWAKYGLLLLSLSKERLLEKTEMDEENDQLKNKDNFKNKNFEDLKFVELEEEIKPIVDQITDKYLLDYNDARLVFLNVQKWLEQAKAYYTLENLASDHVSVVQDISQAYKYLSFFEEHEDRQAKMHKRRIDVLENVIKQLNPQYYKTACRQIWIELGETYSDILDIKFDRINATGGNSTPQVLKKLNHLTNNAIKNFQKLIDSVEVRTSDAGIEKLSDDIVQPTLYSFFHLGRLYNKLITTDKKIQLENTKKSIDAYKFVIDYCEKYPEAAEAMRVELSLCKELVDLLPLKASRLQQEIMN